MHLRWLWPDMVERRFSAASPGPRHYFRGCGSHTNDRHSPGFLLAELQRRLKAGSTLAIPKLPWSAPLAVGLGPADGEEQDIAIAEGWN